MIIHLSQIPAEEGKHYEGEKSATILDLETDEIRAVSPIRYSLDVGLSDGGLFATGSVGIDLELECVRCLEKFSFPIVIEDFATQVELTGSETVDLTPMIREDILLALPPYPRCDSDGGMKCIGTEKFKTNKKQVEPESSTTDAWDVLDRLKVE